MTSYPLFQLPSLSLAQRVQPTPPARHTTALAHHEKTPTHSPHPINRPAHFIQHALAHPPLLDPSNSFTPILPHALSLAISRTSPSTSRMPLTTSL
ncbi:hypothetical protein FA13DRAFT_1738015 [Coprinellus micaceus]|uniref:Uncharacterized protein n=1 Tax=Coprinellus micaceus TaxID=71717 RepID=A0A4Y7SWT0_COPMI|nr:hypothetical protein FA13DRAFT_1738015 [Coprinellus micaceus]